MDRCRRRDGTTTAVHHPKAPIACPSVYTGPPELRTATAPSLYYTILHMVFSGDIKVTVIIHDLIIYLHAAGVYTTYTPCLLYTQ
jgi:hypothetical protein